MAHANDLPHDNPAEALLNRAREMRAQANSVLSATGQPDSRPDTSGGATPSADHPPLASYAWYKANGLDHLLGLREAVGARPQGHRDLVMARDAGRTSNRHRGGCHKKFAMAC